MNPVSAGCGDSVEDAKTNTDGASNNTTGWFWISDSSSTISKKKMRTSQSFSSLQLFTIKSSSAKPDKGISPQREEPNGGVSGTNDESSGHSVGRAIFPRRSVSLINMADIDKGLDARDEVMKRSNEIDDGKVLDTEGGHLTDKGRFFENDIGRDGTIGNHGVDIAENKSGVSHQANEEDKIESQGNKKETLYNHPDTRQISWEDKEKKLQQTIKTLRRSNSQHQEEISDLNDTLADESNTRRLLHEELEASRKLCCEMYENLIKERTNRRSSDGVEAERHLSPKALSFSVSDAAVQTEPTEPSELRKIQDDVKEKSDTIGKSCVLSPKGDRPSTKLQGTSKYGPHLSLLLEEYQESQKHLECQLKVLSGQCREKDDHLRDAKEKLGGHIRLNAMLQSEKVCLEETIGQLREELQSCDRLIATCETVLKEKDQEIRRLEEAKFELERQVVEFEYKENELQKTALSFRDDIGDLASERRRLRKCVKKMSGHHRQKQVNVIQVQKDSKRNELNTKTKLLDAIREIAFKYPTHTPHQDSGQTEGIGKTTKSMTNRQEGKTSENTVVKEKKSYLVCSTKETVLSGTSSVIQKSSTHSISQESLLSDDSGHIDGSRGGRKNAEEREDRSMRNKIDAICKAMETRKQGLKDDTEKREPKRESLDSESSDWDTDDWSIERKSKTEEGEDDIRKSKLKSSSAHSLSSDWDTETSWEDEILQDDTASCAHNLTSNDQEAPESSRCKNESPGSVINDQDKDTCQVTSSCQGLYRAVVNQLMCKNAAAAAPPKNRSQSSSSSPSMDEVSFQGDNSSSDSLLSDSEEDSSQSKAGTDDLHSNDPTVRLESYKCKDTQSRHGAKYSSNNSNKSSRDGGECYQLKDIRRDPVTEYLVLPNQEINPKNTSKDGVYEEDKIGKNSVKDGHDEVTELCIKEEDNLSSGFDDEEVFDEEYPQQHGEHEVMSSEDESFREHSSWQQEKSISEEEYLEDPKMDSWASRKHRSSNNQFLTTGQRHQASENFLTEGNSSRLEGASANGRQTHIPKSRRFGFIPQDNLQEQSVSLQQPEQPRAQNAPYFPDCRGGYGPDELRLGDAIFHLGSSRASESDVESQYVLGRFSPVEEAVPAEGLILRKQVMENYATRANDRSWRYVYMVQQGSTLMFYKDRLGRELEELIDKPLPLTSAIVSVAKDYTRRRHVFRVQLPSGYQYLFAACDDREMMYWVCRLDAAAAPRLHLHGNQEYGFPHPPASITTIPPPRNGSPSRKDRLKNLIRGGISALRR